MATPQKFRSVKAFQELDDQQASGKRTLAAARPWPETESVSPFRVLALLKERPNGVTRAELAHDLQIVAAALDGALLKLYKEGLVEVHAGSRTEDDVVKVL